MPIKLEILYEDNHVLVVNKKPGMLSQGDLSGDLDVLQTAKQLIKVRDNKPGNVYLGLVHRLDRPVGGAMILAKTSKAASRLSEQFRTRQTEKIYHAVVEGIPAKTSGTLKHYLQKDRKTRVTRIIEEENGGKRAKLDYRILGSNDRICRLEIQLWTGFAHQIRVQLASIGHPILGDRKYGADPGFIPKTTRGTIALYAHAVSFSHPTSKEEIRVQAPEPPTLPWTTGECLSLI